MATLRYATLLLLLIGAVSAHASQPFKLSEQSDWYSDVDCRFAVTLTDINSVQDLFNTLLLKMEDRYEESASLKRGRIFVKATSSNSYLAQFRMQLLGFKNEAYYIVDDWVVSATLTYTDKIYVRIRDKNNTDWPETNFVLVPCNGTALVESAIQPSGQNSDEGNFEDSVETKQDAEVSRLRNFEWTLGNVYNKVSIKLLTLGVKGPSIKRSAEKYADIDKKRQKRYFETADESALERTNKRAIETNAYYCRVWPGGADCR